MYNFRNDYSQGAHPRVLEALSATNLEGNIGYGDDRYCAEAAELIRSLCKAPDAEVQFLIGGTQANFISLCAFLRPWEGVICVDSAHINGHEAGAVEATGHKIITVPGGPDSKITPEQIRQVTAELDNPHLVDPGLVYITDATEHGAVYTLAELEAISACCKELGLLLYVDGARLGCALSSPANDITLADLARLTDAFYIGGTKNGALMGEALVLCNPALQHHFFTLKKQRGGVLAKGWLLGVQFLTLLKDGLYFELAAHADRMAARLQDGIKQLHIPLLTESPTNQVFPIISGSLRSRLQEFAIFEDWAPAGEDLFVVRFVTNFATSEEDVDGLLAKLRELI